MSRSSIRIVSLSAVALAVFASSGCNEVRGRKRVQEANQLYKDGNYKDAIAAFEEAEKLIPEFPVLWLNKGYTCRQQVVPGAKTPESQQAAECALTSFKRYMELKPSDSRGEMLYVQTLFDADKFEALSKMYEERFSKNPRDIDAITGLIQVYTKWNKVEEALQWYAKKAEVNANDPEAQYSVGVFIWQQLSQKGGGPDKATFDPRPDPNKPKEKKTPPPFGYGDLISQQRIDMADMGIQYLQKAVAMRPKYHEAMTYLGLLNRQKSFAFFDSPEDWQKTVDEAEKWRKASLEAQGKPVAATPPANAGAGEGGGELAAAAGAAGAGAAAAAVAGDKPEAKSAKAKGKGKKKASKGKRRK
jgi:tetratricopeptide (TPR) repeat protein